MPCVPSSGMTVDNQPLRSMIQSASLLRSTVKQRDTVHPFVQSQSHSVTQHTAPEPKAMARSAQRSAGIGSSSCITFAAWLAAKMKSKNTADDNDIDISTTVPGDDQTLALFSWVDDDDHQDQVGVGEDTRSVISHTPSHGGPGRRQHDHGNGGDCASEAGSDAITHAMAGQRSRMWMGLCTRLGGLDRQVWSISSYEDIFGTIGDNENVFGDRLWAGMVKYFNDVYTAPNSKGYYLADRRHYVPWMGAFITGEKFSAAEAKVSDGLSPWQQNAILPTQLYPAIALLSPKQHDDVIKLRATQSDIRAPHLLQGSSVVHGVVTDAAISVSWLGIQLHWSLVSSDDIGHVTVVCLKILLAGSRAWEAHMDNIHLYAPVPAGGV